MKPLRLPLAAAAALAALAAACAPVVQGGPPLELTPDLVAGARVRTIAMSSERTDGDEDFSDTFLTEVGEELDRCATGDRLLELRVNVVEYDREGRLQTLARGGGEHYIGGLAEFVDPQTRQVVGRYTIRTLVQAGGPGLGGTVRAVFADRDMVASEAFGRALCLEAFGRNPRPPGILNATPG